MNTGTVEENAEAAEKFGKFVHALLLSWLDSSDATSEKKAVSEVICLHLKELSASAATSPTIVAYLSSQMLQLTELLRTLREIEDDNRDQTAIDKNKAKMLPRYFKSLMRLQRVFIDVLECPGGRLLDCLLALST